MKNIIWLNVITLFLLFIWLCGMFIIAISGSHNSPVIKDIVIKFVIANYPIGIALLFFLMNLSFFGIRGSIFLLIVSLLVILPNHFLFNSYINDYFLLRGRSIHGPAITDKVVYFNTRRIKGADPKTFKKAEHPKDYKNYSYHQRRYFYLDNKYVFRDGKIVEGADPNSFVVHSNEIASDKNMVYYIRYHSLIKLGHVDPNTLVVDSGEGRYHDKDNFYIGQIRLDVPKDYKRTSYFGVSQGFIWKIKHPSLKALKADDIEYKKIPYPGDPGTTLPEYGDDIVKDKEALYEYRVEENRYLILSKPHLKSLKSIDRDSSSEYYAKTYYYEDKDSIYYLERSPRPQFVKIEPVNKTSFQVSQDLDSKFDATDGVRFFSKGKVISN